MDKKCDRREFLKSTGLQGLGLTLGAMGLTGCTSSRVGTAGSAPAAESAVKPLIDTIGGPQIKVGFVGVGGMGSGHVKNLLGIPGVQLRAVCDIVPEKVARIQDWAEKAGQPKPTGYSQGETDFKRMCQTEDLDLVYTATPWELHVPVCLAAMEAGKHAATEVPAAVTLDDCWKLVEASEKTGKHCVMMENCCYDQVELMILNMVRKGLLGELLHGECGYLHDLRHVKFAGEGEALWRTAHSIKRNGNLYPTHGR
jgi:predicted dehydrogenase